MDRAGVDFFVKEFQRRRKRVLRCFAFSTALVIVALGLLEISDRAHGFFTVGSGFGRALAASQLAAALVFAVIGYNQYRCPSCNDIIKGHDRYYLGIVFDPEECPRCGKPLK